MSKGQVERESAQNREQWEIDAEIIQAAARGEVLAQRRLLQCSLPVVKRTVRYLLGSNQEVQDAIQASLLAVLEAAKRFRGQSTLTTWVTRITVRTTLRWIQRQRALVPEAFADPEVGLPSYDPETGPAYLKLRTYLDRLPEAQRTALILRYGLDYHVNEIAEATDSSKNTVKYRLKEALVKMRQCFRRDSAIRGPRHEP